MTAYKRFYETRIAPVLLGMQGCLFAGLVQHDTHPDECISMSIWASRADADAYEKSGLYDALIEENKPYLAASSEWKVRLTDDLTLEYQPVHERPVVRAFPIALGSEEVAPSHAAATHMYLRIVSATVEPGQFDALKAYYESRIMPALLGLEGCQYVYLVQGIQNEQEVLSVTLWDAKPYADRYEQSGLFEKLVEGARPFLSSLYQWRMALESSRGSAVATSEDLSVEGYHFVAGESM